MADEQKRTDSKKTDTRRLYDVERAIDSVKKDNERHLHIVTGLDSNVADLKETVDEAFRNDEGRVVRLRDLYLEVVIMKRKLKSLDRWQAGTAIFAIIAAIFSVTTFAIEVGWVKL